MKTARKLHLWIGIITSFFILMEAITGLLLSEPWLIGASQVEGRGFPMHQAQPSNISMQGDNAGDQAAFRGEKMNGSAGLMGVIRGLHEGKFAGSNLKVVVDLTAIGLIILTTTGIVLSVRALKAQSLQRRKTIATGN